MANKTIKDIVVVTKPAPSFNLTNEEVAFFTAAGAPYVPLTVASNRMPVQADSVAATVGALVTDFNALLTKLKNAGLMASS